MGIMDYLTTAFPADASDADSPSSVADTGEEIDPALDAEPADALSMDDLTADLMADLDSDARRSRLEKTPRGSRKDGTPSWKHEIHFAPHWVNRALVMKTLTQTCACGHSASISLGLFVKAENVRSRYPEFRWTRTSLDLDSFSTLDVWELEVETENVKYCPECF
jgi:hypothetical protein